MRLLKTRPKLDISYHISISPIEGVPPIYCTGNVFVALKQSSSLPLNLWNA